MWLRAPLNAVKFIKEFLELKKVQIFVQFFWIFKDCLFVYEITIKCFKYNVCLLVNREKCRLKKYCCFRAKIKNKIKNYYYQLLFKTKQKSFIEFSIKIKIFGCNISSLVICFYEILNFVVFLFCNRYVWSKHKNLAILSNYIQCI